MRNKTVRFVFILAMVLLLSPLTGTVMAKESVVIYTNWSLDDVEGIKKAFEADNPNIEATFFRAAIEELFTILDLEMQTGQVKADAVIFGDPMRAELFKANGWLAPLNLSDDTVKMIDKSFLDPDGYIAPYMLQLVTLQFNKNYVKKAPTSWADLLDPKYKGRIAMGDPKTTGMVHVPMWFITQYLGRKVGSPFGWDYFRQLAKLGPRLVDGHRTIRDLIATGEISIGIQTLDNCIKSVAEGEPTGYAYMKEGTPALYQAVGVIKGARNLKNARIFANWLLSYNGQKAVNEVIGTLPVRKGVPVVAGETVEEISKFGPVVIVGPELTPQLRAEQTETYYKSKDEASR